MDKDKYNIYHETKNHTPDTFPYNTYLCSIPMDFKSIAMHWHKDIEIIVVKKGCGLICVNLNTYTVNAGDMVFVFSGQLHSISQKDEETMEYENIIFKPELLKSSGYDLYNDNLLQPLLLGNLNFCPVISNNSKANSLFFSIINEIDKLCDLHPYAYQLSVKAQLFQLLYLLLSNCNLSRTKPDNQKSLDKIKIILSYVANNFKNNISIEDISNYCHYSQSYFMKFFKDAMGKSFIQYLNDYRLDVAAKLLISTSDDIIDIAINTGFENLSYFNRSFKKKYGITPGKYRKLFH